MLPPSFDLRPPPIRFWGAPPPCSQHLWETLISLLNTLPTKQISQWDHSACHTLPLQNKFSSQEAKIILFFFFHFFNFLELKKRRRKSKRKTNKKTNKQIKKTKAKTETTYKHNTTISNDSRANLHDSVDDYLKPMDENVTKMKWQRYWNVKVSGWI